MWDSENSGERLKPDQDLVNSGGQRSLRGAEGSKRILTWAPLVPTRDHGTHRESHALVLIHHVGQKLGGSRHRDALLVTEFVDAALPGQQALPETAVSCSASHCAQEVRVNLNDLLDRL